MAVRRRYKGSGTLRCHGHRPLQLPVLCNKQWVDDYYRILKTECVPIGHAVNANIAMVRGFSVHADAEEAKRRGEDGFKFFGYALARYAALATRVPAACNPC